jgi:hypothetical protein
MCKVVLEEVLEVAVVVVARGRLNLTTSFLMAATTQSMGRTAWPLPRPCSGIDSVPGYWTGSDSCLASWSMPGGTRNYPHDTSSYR